MLTFALFKSCVEEGGVFVVLDGGRGLGRKGGTATLGRFAEIPPPSLQVY